MRGWMGLVALSLVVGCSGDGKGGKGNGNGNGPTETTTDPGTTPLPTELPATCENAQALLAALDLDGAKEAYEACLAANPNDANASFGLGFTSLATLYTDPTFADGLERCDESSDLSPTLYGDDGLMMDLHRDYQGGSELTLSFTDSSGTEVLEEFNAPAVHLAWFNEEEYYGSTWDSVTLEVADTVGYRLDFVLHLYHNDAYQDGSAVSIGAGTVLDVQPGFPAYLYASCERCEWPNNSSQTGQVTVNEFGSDNGAAIEVEVDLEWQLQDGAGTYSLTGSISDTVGDYPEPTELPFYDGAYETECWNDEHCAWETEFLSVIRELCPDLGSQGDAMDLADDMAETLDEIAGHFDDAAADQGLSFAVPPDHLFFFYRDTPFNQADALGLAASVRSAMAGIHASTSYTLVDDSTSLDDFHTDSYTAGDLGYYGYQCIEEDYYGIPLEDVATELHDEALELRKGDLEAFRGSLRDAIITSQAALNASPNGAGIFDFSGSDLDAFRTTLDDDLAAVVDSLDGQDGPLPSTNGYDLTLGDFFDTSPDRSSVLAEVGESSLFDFYLWRDCEPSLDLTFGTTEWLEEGAGAVVLSRQVRDNETLPRSVDEDAWDSLIDNQDEMRALTPEAKQIFYGDWYAY